MSRRTILCLLYLIASLAMPATASVKYRTAELQRLCRVMGIRTESLSEGDNLLPKGLTVHLSADGTIDHVGRALFSPEAKAEGDLLVMHFLERYLLQLAHPKSETTAAYMLRDDNVRFERGSLQTARTIAPTDAFSLRNDNGRCTASWGNHTAISFPAEYQLLSGEDKEEAELLIESDIRGASAEAAADTLDAEMLQLAVEPYYKLSGGTYFTEQLSASLYYEKMTDGDFRLVADATHPAESAANMMLSAATEGDYRLSVQQNIYGFQTKQFSVPLRQWVNFCRQSGCDLYFGVEEMKGDQLKATVIAVCPTAGYNHLLTFTLPIQTIDQRQGDISATLYAYVPTHNLKNLFGKYRKTKKNKIKRKI